MSAWLVSKNHIDVLVSWAVGIKLNIPWSGNTFNDPWTAVPELATHIGQKLWDENYESINCRYEEGKKAPIYEYKYNGQSAIVVFKQVQCYDYQTCECGNYENSFAYAFVKAAEKKFGELGYSVTDGNPAYEAAPWGID